MKKDNPLPDEELNHVIEIEIESTEKKLIDELHSVLPFDDDDTLAPETGAVQPHGNPNERESRQERSTNGSKHSIKSRVMYPDRRGASALMKKLAKTRRLRNRARPGAKIEIHECPGGATTIDYDCAEHVTDRWDQAARR